MDKLTGEAIKWSQLRACEFYRENICSKCHTAKPCNDLDIIVCAIANKEFPTNNKGNGK